MAKKIIITIIGILAITGFIVGTKVMQIRTMISVAENTVPPPTVVTATAVQPETWENLLHVTGTFAAVQGLTVSAEVAGKITRLDFESGARVKAGDLLAQQDVGTEQAQFRAAQSSVALAKLNLDRDKDLLAKQTISQAEFDAADAQFKQAEAQADNLQAVIAKKSIRAPFAGRLGLRLVNLGQILKEGDPIVTLETLDPIYINFSLPQQQLSAIAPGSTVHVTSDVLPGRTVDGRVNAINPEVDPATRNVRVQATLANPDEKLRPGMFASVDVVLPDSEHVLAVPASAVLYAPYGDSIFIVDEKKNEKTGAIEKVLRQQFVRLGNTRGDFVAVASGLKAGETVVTSGVFKLHAGMVVIIDNTLAPDAKLAPNPREA